MKIIVLDAKQLVKQSLNFDMAKLWIRTCKENSEMFSTYFICCNMTM